jgi:hypothetical protein
LVAATSSAPSAEPCALPVFCLFGAGQPMIVRSAMNEGLVGLGLGGLDRRVQRLDVLVVDAVAGRPRVDAARASRTPRSASPTSSDSAVAVSSSMEIWLSS